MRPTDLYLASSLAALSTPVLVAVAVLVVIEIALDAYALVDLYRRPVAQVVAGNKWIWVAIILLVNLLGAILYLAIGRNAGVVADKTSTADRPREHVESIVDSLYGKPDTAQRS